MAADVSGGVLAAGVVARVLQCDVDHADLHLLQQRRRSRVLDKEVVVGSHRDVRGDEEVARIIGAHIGAEQGGRTPVYRQPHGLVTRPDVVRVEARAPRVRDERGAAASAVDRVGERGVVAAHLDLLDSVAPTLVLDQAGNEQVASPAVGATINLKHTITGHLVGRLVEIEQVIVPHKLVKSSDAVLFHQRLVGQQALDAAALGLKAHLRHVIAHQRAVGHLARNERIVVRIPRVGPEIELALSHSHIRVRRRKLNIRGLAHLIAQLLQQMMINSRLEITRRPISPSHRHTDTLTRRHIHLISRSSIISSRSSISRSSISRSSIISSRSIPRSVIVIIATSSDN